MAEKKSTLVELPIEKLLSRLSEVPADVRTTIRNHGGGYYNHALFWKLLRSPREQNIPKGEIGKEISKQFGSFEKFVELFSLKAISHFGSGWTWLYFDKSKQQLKVESFLNQDNPVMENKDYVPLLGIDVWEHRYANINFYTDLLVII
jgi:Fe-Mn family superoxide dismutase